MRKLEVPQPLKTEFATIELIWHSSAMTRRVDSLLLSWVKYEKQLRRLFSFFVFQHPKITIHTLDSTISAFASNRNLKPETFIVGLTKLGIDDPKSILGEKYNSLWPEVNRIREYRNKIMHGQHTGQKIGSPQLERDVLILIDWMSCIGNAYDEKYGYDGLRRKVYFAAKSNSNLNVGEYPFSSPSELQQWLSKLKVKANN
ncbi:MAG: hypothetical protein RKH07_14890 [Gammaproteobacteria bacterium]